MKFQLRLLHLAMSCMLPLIANASDNGGITLPPGFSASVFADNLGHARHLVVAPNGVVYVNTWFSNYYSDKTPPKNSFIVALQDTQGSGKADVIKRFGSDIKQGSHGGTGIQLYHGALYVEVDNKIVRYTLPPNSIVPTGKPEVIVRGLPTDGDHPMHPFIIDKNGNLFVDLGLASNACQQQNRMLQTAGHQPCTELETRGGIWRYDANKTKQKFSAKERYATGIRNSEGMAVDEHGQLFATQHGRDQLSQNWPQLYKPIQSAELPAEELLLLEKDADYGWPECYFDHAQKKLVLAPEYGGDGGKKVGICAQKRAPVAFYPAHWGPNDLLIYSGIQFPASYRKGAFIAFHGSWNRAPFPQGGYNVVYQPMANGAPSGKYSVFADGFAGKIKEPEGAAFRPTGLAMGPDGALYIADDQHGRIWRVIYNGDTQLKAAPPQPQAAAKAATLDPRLPLPQGANKAQLVEGFLIFHGKKGASCTGCHGSDAKGSAFGPNLTSGKWLWGDGGVKSIAQTIKSGVPTPKQHQGAMPAMGGSPLSDADLTAVAIYVWSIGHQTQRATSLKHNDK